MRDARNELKGWLPFGCRTEQVNIFITVCRLNRYQESQSVQQCMRSTVDLRPPTHSHPQNLPCLLVNDIFTRVSLRKIENVTDLNSGVSLPVSNDTVSWLYNKIVEDGLGPLSGICRMRQRHQLDNVQNMFASPAHQLYLEHFLSLGELRGYACVLNYMNTNHEQVRSSVREWQFVSKWEKNGKNCILI